MNRRYLLRLVTVAVLSSGFTAGSVRAEGRMRVMTSFSILGDMVRQVGGDRVAVTTLVGPNGDAHVYQPTPADARALGESKVLVLNGLGFEGWITRLEQSSAFKGFTITASEGVKPFEARAERGSKAGSKMVTDPHAWQSLSNGRLYVQNIRDGLIAADPAGKATYEANAEAFMSAITMLDAEVMKAIEAIPVGQRKIITSHDAFGYFGRAYGMAFIAPEGLSTENAASAQGVARIIDQIRAEKVPAVFVENITDKRLLEQIRRETGAKIGGTLFSDVLSQLGGPAPTYLHMFRHNLRTLSAALRS